MELGTASDLFVTASLALLLSFLVAKLVSLAMTDTHSTTNNRDEPVFLEERLAVQTAASESRVGFITPVQVETVMETESEIEEEANVEPCSNVVDEFPVKSDIAVDGTKEVADDESRIGFICPVQVAAIVETERITEVEAIVEPDSDVVDEFPVKSDIGGDETKEKIAEEEIHDSAEQRNAECVDENEITIGKPAVSVAESKGRDEDDEKMNEEEIDDSAEHRIAECVDENEITVEKPAVVVAESEEIDYDEEKITEEDIDDSAEKKNAEFVDENEIAVEKHVVSVAESKERDDDDDWEGIERSELEKEFMAATEFVGGEGDRLASVGSNVQMEMYALHKLATEGPCRDPQPMPLKLSARAKWNAWQKLGNMSPEVAMEQYISILSDKVPGWMKDTSAGKSEHDSTGSKVFEVAGPDLSASLSRQQMIVTEREIEQESGAQDLSPLTQSNMEKNVQK